MNKDNDMERIPFTCTLDCGSRCELVACVRNGRLVRIDTPQGRPDTAEMPRLVPCVRGRAHRRLQNVPERLLYPLRRVGPRGSDDFERISWDEALDEIAERLHDVRARYGEKAILHASGAGSMSGRGFSGGSASTRFFSYWGEATELTGSMSNYCARMAAIWMLGDVISGSDRATLLDSRLILMWGMNPAENHMGPNTPHFIAQARDRGARVVLIDPRYTDSAVLADEWVPIRPGTDAALAAAMAYVIETEGLADAEFLSTHTAGYDVYRRYLLGEDGGTSRTPAWAADITGVSAETIVRLACEYATNRPAALLAGWAPQRTYYGEQASRAVITLACMSGNVGIRGGGVASLGTRYNIVPLETLPLGPHRAARHLSSTSWAAPVLSGELDPPVRLAYIVASNLINRSPNTLANARALETMDFVVVQEPFFTPTARYADIVLPICTDLERPDLVTSWGHDVHLFYNRQVLPPMAESRTDYAALAGLAERLGFGDEYTGGKNEAGWVAEIMAGSPFAEALERDGVWRGEAEPRVALAEFRADPQAHPLRTPSGRIEIATPAAESYGLPLIPAYIPVDDDGADDYPLQLLTPHSRLRSNSCVYANPWLQRLEEHAVWINTADAEARGIAQGDMVEVINKRGTVALPAYVTGRIMPGVTCIYQGTWYRPDEKGVDVGASANVLTSHRLSPSGGPGTHSARVQIRRRGA